MVQPSKSPNNPSVDVDRHVALCPTQRAAYVPTGSQAEAVKGLDAGPSVRVRTHPLRQVVVLEVVGPLGDAGRRTGPRDPACFG